VNKHHFDIIVIGAGHAGVEAGLACARMGMQTLMITINLDNVALMPCNPSIGGSAKGHLVREIDALGGQMAKTIDQTLLQIRVLNKKKGPAIQAYRAQADKVLYQAKMKSVLESEENLHLLQGVVSEILEENQRVIGVKTLSNQIFHSKAVIVTTGTFLNGVCHIGQTQIKAGRIGEPPAHHLSTSISSYGIESGRLKTGTPPRILDISIDLKSLEMEHGDNPMPTFSFMTKDPLVDEQIPCFICHTTEQTRELMLSSLHLSPLYSGQIEGIGPRYCPSIEDKYKKFPDKKSHLLYLEPESRFNHEIYLQGFSTSLPHEVQIQLIHTLPGMDKAQTLRPGYAVEYDFFNPIQLHLSLESKVLEGLFFAGQVNGTSGYEEAGAQGIIAGMNAALKLQGKSPVNVNRENSYIGVLIHDLVTKGTKEPYRMFSSLVEHRTFIRHNNADFRLTSIAHEAGLACSNRMDIMNSKREDIESIQHFLEAYRIHEDHPVIEKLNTAGFSGKRSLKELLRRPEIRFEELIQYCDEFRNLVHDKPLEAVKEAEVEIKYAGYIEKQMAILKQRETLSSVSIPDSINYHDLIALSNEGRQKLLEVRPVNLAQASLISGIRQSDLALLASHIKRNL